MAELLLELLSEEIPARMQWQAADDLRRLFTESLKAAGLEYSKAETYVTPRRLTLVVDGLPKSQPDLREEKRGPRVGSPEKAIEGFLKGAGISSIEQAEKRATDKGEFYFAVIERKGRNTREVLPEMILSTVLALPWPKSMRWGDTTFRWVRPLKGVLAIFDGATLEGGIPLGKITASWEDGTKISAAEVMNFQNVTVGHRFSKVKSITVSSFQEYKQKLFDADVILDPVERDLKITKEMGDLLGPLNLVPDWTPLREVVGLVEWPVALLGNIDPEFMDVPQEVLITSMRTHQKYFACLRPDGSLAPHFVVVSNTKTEDGGKIVVAGNERVLRARLSDAKFFWDQDRKLTLEEWAPKLRDVIFQDKLGTMAQKRSRIGGLASAIAEEITKSDPIPAWKAGNLCKADLVTGMVGEFPELQGIIGGYYAKHEGLSEEVSLAIAEHYSPAGPNDRCPTAPTSVALALADKIDTLSCFWWIGEKPTGSRDPFALRRAALGIIRLILENQLRISLKDWLPYPMAMLSGQEEALQSLEQVDALKKALDKFSVSKAEMVAIVENVIATGSSWKDESKEFHSKIDKNLDELLAFFADRLKVHLREQGVRHDLVNAVFALGSEDDLVRLMARVRALQEFLASDNGKNLLVAYNRAANIVRAEEKKDRKSYAGTLDTSLLKQDEEKAVATALDAATPKLEQALAAEDFVGAMGALAGLRGPLDAFFDKVTVNADDAALRLNRLNLLTRIRSAMDRVADFSKIEG